MVLYGRSWRVGDNVPASAILDPIYADAGDPALLAAQCLANVAPEIAEGAREGDLLLTGQNFGAGTDAEAAVLALQALGIAAVIAASADAGFVREAAAYGLPVLDCPEAVAEAPVGAVLRLDLVSGLITVHNGLGRFAAPPCSPELVAAVQRTQLLAATRRVVESEGFAE